MKLPVAVAAAVIVAVAAAAVVAVAAAVAVAVTVSVAFLPGAGVSRSVLKIIDLDAGCWLRRSCKLLTAIALSDHC